MLGWHVLAGADTVVDGPRNWLAAAEIAAPRQPVVDAPRAAGAAGAAPVRESEAAGLATAADSLDALAAAITAFAHPLRAPGVMPQLASGNLTSGLWVIADQPEAEGSPAARLRTRMLAAIGLAPADHGLAHLLPWPTTGGRPPRDDEIAAFAPFIARALVLSPPRLILALGDRAAGLSGPVRGIASARGRWLAAAGVPLLATFHPRILLAQPELKRLAWADLQAFAAKIGTAR